jgi:hypothetical protein
MSSTDSSAGDHAYFQAIEERFIQLRGAPLLLAPADWQLARQWRDSGIPLTLILETLERVFARRAESGARGRVQGLRYCAPAIEAAWQNEAEMQATGSRESPPALDLGARLHALSTAVRALDFGAADVADDIDALAGSPDVVERALVDLDRRLLELAERHLDQATLDEIGASVEQSLKRVRERLAEGEVARVRSRLYRETVRRRSDLPVLSLFEDRF